MAFMTLYLALNLSQRVALFICLFFWVSIWMKNQTHKSVSWFPEFGLEIWLEERSRIVLESGDKWFGGIKKKPVIFRSEELQPSYH